MGDSKDTNPKDAVGTKKVPFGVLPLPVLGEVALALLEGARKYGRHNWRKAGVRASVYIDAAVMRHIAPFWEGEDTDPDSQLSHITKAIAGLTILRDSMIQGNWIDDRPPKSPDSWKDKLNIKAGEIVDKYPEALEPFTELNTNSEVCRVTEPDLRPDPDPDPAYYDSLFEAGDKVEFIKEGRIGWEGADYAAIGGFKEGDVFTIKESIGTNTIRVEGCNFYLHVDHFKKIED